MQVGYRPGYTGRADREGSSSCWEVRLITHRRLIERRRGACTAKGWTALPEAAGCRSEEGPRETGRLVRDSAHTRRAAEAVAAKLLGELWDETTELASLRSEVKPRPSRNQKGPKVKEVSR